MAQTVNVIGYGPITFPDGMSREQMAEALKKLPPLPGTAAPEVPAAPQTVMDKLAASPVGGVVRGLRDVAEGTAQFAARGAEQLPVIGQFIRPARQSFEQAMTAGERQYRQDRTGQLRPDELDVGRMVGNVGGTLLPSTAAVRALNLAAKPVKAGAVSGAVSGAMQPVQTGATAPTLSDLVTETRPRDMSAGEYFTQKAQQIGFGGALGAGGGYLTDKMMSILFGSRAPGMATPAPGPAPGPATAQAQSSATATATPTATVTGGQVTPGVVGADASAALTEAQRAILERGKMMGFRTTPGQETGSRSLQQMEARMESSPFTSGPFNEIKATNQKILNQSAAQAIGVNASELSNPVLAQAQRQISAVYNRVASPTVQKIDQPYVLNGIDLLDNAFEGLTTQPFKSNIFVKQLQDLALKGEATGNQLSTLSSKIGKRAKNEMTTATGDRELGQALFQMKEIVDDALSSGLSTADQLAFQAARANYRNLMTLRSSPGVVNPSSGNVSAPNLASALTRKDPRGFVFGENQTPMYEAARFGQAFKPIVGDSGTATRTMEYTPLNVMLSMPTNLAAQAYTSAPATALASRLQTGLLPAGVTNAATEELMRRALPVTAGAGLVGSLLGQ
jgi:hypothetical protein